MLTLLLYSSCPQLLLELMLDGLVVVVVVEEEGRYVQYVENDSKQFPRVILAMEVVEIL